MSEDREFRWRIEDQIHYPLINEISLSPDNGRVVYTVREPLLTEERSEYITHLYIADVETGETLQLTRGEHANRYPRWSPNGRHIAFISTRNEKPNIYAIDTRGGEAWALTSNKKSGVSRLEWSPDGRTIGFLMTVPTTEEKEKSGKAKDDAYLWHEDYEYTHLYTVPFTVGPKETYEPKQVTGGKLQVINFDWLPDSRTVALLHQPTPLADDWPESRLAKVVTDVEEPYKPEDLDDIALTSAWSGGVKVSHDGRWIACTTGDQPPVWAFSSRIILYPTKGGAPRLLAQTPDSQGTLVGWSEYSDAVIISESWGVATQIYELPVSGGECHALTSSETRKKAATVSPSGLIAFAAEDFETPNSIYVLDDGSERLVLSPRMPRNWPHDAIPRCGVMRWTSKDGKEIEGVVTYPLGYQEGMRYPLIVEVHGGPTGVYGRSYYAAPMNHGNTAVLAERGFMILRVNPRGSSGYGKEFRFANYDDWGGGDYKDIMAGVDHLIERGLADPERMGVMGWSYGGYMTSWVITQTDRFKASVVGAGVNNLMSFNGTTDVPRFVPDYFHGNHWERFEEYTKHSALFQVGGVKTPTLIQHGEKDARVPLGQGMELYNALKQQGVPVQMVIYPRQPHGVGEPRLQIDVRRRPVEWFERWVLGRRPPEGRSLFLRRSQHPMAVDSNSVKSK